MNKLKELKAKYEKTLKDDDYKADELRGAIATINNITHNANVVMRKEDCTFSEIRGAIFQAAKDDGRNVLETEYTLNFN